MKLKKIVMWMMVRDRCFKLIYKALNMFLGVNSNTLDMCWGCVYKDYTNDLLVFHSVSIDSETAFLLLPVYIYGVRMELFNFCSSLLLYY